MTKHLKRRCVLATKRIGRLDRGGELGIAGDTKESNYGPQLVSLAEAFSQSQTKLKCRLGQVVLK